MVSTPVHPGFVFPGSPLSSPRHAASPHIPSGRLSPVRQGSPIRQGSPYSVRAGGPLVACGGDNLSLRAAAALQQPRRAGVAPVASVQPIGPVQCPSPSSPAPASYVFISGPVPKAQLWQGPSLPAQSPMAQTGPLTPRSEEPRTPTSFLSLTGAHTVPVPPRSSSAIASAFRWVDTNPFLAGFSTPTTPTGSAFGPDSGPCFDDMCSKQSVDVMEMSVDTTATTNDGDVYSYRIRPRDVELPCEYPDSSGAGLGPDSSSNNAGPPSLPLGTECSVASSLRFGQTTVSVGLSDSSGGAERSSCSVMASGCPLRVLEEQDRLPNRSPEGVVVVAAPVHGKESGRADDSSGTSEEARRLERETRRATCAQMKRAHEVAYQAALERRAEAEVEVDAAEKDLASFEEEEKRYKAQSLGIAGSSLLQSCEVKLHILEERRNAATGHPSAERATSGKEQVAERPLKEPLRRSKVESHTSSRTGDHPRSVANVSPSRTAGRTAAARSVSPSDRCRTPPRAGAILASRRVEESARPPTATDCGARPAGRLHANAKVCTTKPAAKSPRPANKPVRAGVAQTPVSRGKSPQRLSSPGRGHSPPPLGSKVREPVVKMPHERCIVGRSREIDSSRPSPVSADQFQSGRRSCRVAATHDAASTLPANSTVVPPAPRLANAEPIVKESSPDNVTPAQHIECASSVGNGEADAHKVSKSVCFALGDVPVAPNISSEATLKDESFVYMRTPPGEETGGPVCVASATVVPTSRSPLRLRPDATPPPAFASIVVTSFTEPPSSPDETSSNQVAPGLPSTDAASSNEELAAEMQRRLVAMPHEQLLRALVALPREHLQAALAASSADDDGAALHA